MRLSFLTFLYRSSMYLLSFYSILFIRYRCQRNSIIRQCRLQNICSFKPLAQSFTQRRPGAGEPSNWIEIEINWLTLDPLLMLSLYRTVDIIQTKPSSGKKICQWRGSFLRLKAVKAETLMNVVMIKIFSAGQRILRNTFSFTNDHSLSIPRDTIKDDLAMAKMA